MADQQKLIELRRDIGLLKEAGQFLKSEEEAEDAFIRPSDDHIEDLTGKVEVDGEKFNQILDEYDVSGIQEWIEQKEQEFRQKAENFDSSETGDRNLELALQELERDSERPPEVISVVNGEDGYGLRRKWQEADSFSEVEEELVEMVEAFREYSGGDYEEVMHIWEPNISLGEAEQFFNELEAGIKSILAGIPLEDIEAVRAQIEHSFEDKTLEEISDNPKRIHEILTHHVLGGDPLHMPVRIGNYGMEYGDGVFAPLQTKTDDFWAKTLDTTGHEFGHDIGRLHLPLGENAFLPLGEPPSDMADEASARLYQNHVYRNPEFLEFVATHIEDELDIEDVEGEDLYRKLNAIDPDNMERISASPITYPLHVKVRYEIERELIESDEPVENMVEDLPGKWKDKMYELIGEPLGAAEDEFRKALEESETILQDVHWGKGKMGYFPTYSMGDSLAVQWLEEMGEELEEDIGHYIGEGDIGQINAWMEQNVHRYGRDFWNQVETTDLDAGSLIEYLENMAVELYHENDATGN